ncbi:MAG: M48 family metallopeptidase [Cyanobacteria bacterium MAG CAR4_bin_6]|nr:M48 family metallopeptidase [Cyanobacteria bacterium MAG CAR4_bin_6]
MTGRGFQDHIRAWGRWLLVAALLTGCSTSPTGRQQFMLVSPDAAISMTQSAYINTVRQFARRGKLMNDTLLAERMGRITGRLVAVAVREYPHTAGWEWSVALLDDDRINAFAWPGGRMAVFRGLIETLDLSDDEIAHIMGHEIVHALANHTAEKLSMAMAQDLAVSVVRQNTENDSQAATITNTVANIALTLPNSRSAEEEADSLGMRMAVKAGYDPLAAVTLWQKMVQHGGPRRPEFLSTHPDPASRITALSALVDDVQHLRPAAPPEPHRVRIYMQQ